MAIHILSAMHLIIWHVSSNDRPGFANMSEAAILGKFPFSQASPHELDWTPSHLSDHSEV